jgi:NDP-sugar pyrophosphorylase family protein
MKAMILAAGIGSRLRPLTDTRPKCLLEVQGVTLLEHTIRYLMFHGVDEIIINVHHLADQVISFLESHDNFGIRICISDEREGLLDTGGGLKKAAWFFNGNQPFFLTAADVITGLDLNLLLQYHLNQHALATLAVKDRPTTRNLLFDKNMQLCGWRNNQSGEIRRARNYENPIALAFSTIHVIDPVLFDVMTEQGVFSMIDVYLRLAATHPIYGFDHSNTPWFEFGRIENLERLNGSPEISNLFKRHHQLPGKA